MKYQIALLVVAISCTLVGIYFGAAIVLSVCVQTGEYKHRLLDVTVKCQAVRDSK